MGKIYLLLGGWSRSASSYKRLIAATPEGSKLFVMPHIELDIHEKDKGPVQIILDYLNEHNIDKVHLAGQSLGGSLAMKFAATYPDRVEELILIDTAGIYDNKTLISMIGSLLYTHIFVQHAKKKVHQNIGSVIRVFRYPSAYIKAGRFAVTINAQEEAKKITVPTMILWGEKDTMIPPRLGKKLHEIIKGSRYIELPNMDHDWLLHYPQGFWENVGRA